MPDEKDNEKDKIVFTAVYTKDKKIVVDVKCPSFPILSYAYKLLGLHIDNMILKSQIDNAPKIISKGGFESLRKFMGGKN